MDAPVFTCLVVAAGLWAGLLALAVAARPARSSHTDGSSGALTTLLKLWSWLALVVTVAGVGSALAGTKGLAVAVLVLVFASVAVFAGLADAQHHER